MAAGAISFLLFDRRNRVPQSNPLAIQAFIRNSLLALFPFTAGVSHIYQTLFLWYGGFAGGRGRLF
jgi:hypothetical protein